MKQLSYLFVLFAMAGISGVADGDCSVTLPSSSAVLVPNSESDGSFAWYGSEALAVRLPADGRWKGMGPSRNFRDKFWIWRRGYDAKTETRPALTFAGVKMLVGMEFPSAGCWQVTATYVYAGITHDLTFVVDVVTE
jgi:hypothetical protein